MGRGFLAPTCGVDVTELYLVRNQFQATRPVAAVLLLDNYEDLLKNLSENDRCRWTARRSCRWG